MIDFYFNPRSRVGNDYIVCDISCYIANFNPRSRVGNDESGNRLLFCLLLFQSTFPRGERLTCRCQYALDLRISIHVPAWGTTMYTLKLHIIFKISIHVPAWGTTKCPVSTNWISGYFNPRSRVGNDLFQYLCCILADYFNPRSRVGNDKSRMQKTLC